ncbi:hypothetical protein [Prosthecomicrobium sp. N25]|uniref:hypothetical protein n=1 Tax=Prosthecomicrobium sp. N25 TaxID=3129254 RepID=UPI0030789647
MQPFDRKSLLDKASRTGSLDAADVLVLRREVYGDDGRIGPAEAELLFDLEDRITAPVPEWTALFLEAMTDYVVEQTEPQGYVDEAEAQWLLQRITADAKVKSETELELLVRVVERARAVPFRLSAAALAEVRHAVVDGSGVTRHGRLEPGRITMAEVALVRRVLHAAGGERGIAVSREEAEALFDIDDAVGDAENVPEWAGLFAKAVGNYLMAATLHEAPAREEALRRERWLDAPAEGYGTFLDRFVDGLTGFGNLIETLTQSLSDKVEAAHAEDNRRDAAAITDAEALSAGEVDWAVAWIGRNGRVTAAEMALIDFLRRIHPVLPTPLEAVVRRGAA